LDEPCGMALMMKRRCILNCEGENTMYTLPRGEEEKGQWLRFIFNAIPEQYNPRLLLCAVHFTEDCFLNWTQFYCGYSKRLLLKDGAVPTLLSPHRDTGVYVSESFVTRFKIEVRSSISGLNLSRSEFKHD
ncbi:hypothetical protein XENOCAPTIV_029591, partial [Xenoophorus captivus]